MKRFIKPVLTLLVVTLMVGLCYAQAPLKKPKKEKQNTEQTTQQSSTPTKQQNGTSSKKNNTKVSQPDGYINNYGYVDLGLPSGLKWATCNVGASKPEGYGSYFAWGETQTKSSYDEENCATYGKDNSWLRSNGYIDSSGNLTMAHDAARQKWGGSWRMPTKAEIQELIDNTTVSYNGVNGRLVKSKLNGKSIFLPAAGFREGTSLNWSTGECGYYWSATLDESYSSDAYYLLSWNDGDFRCGRFTRFSGLPVRPVSE